jgi:small subunit ribosomal protein S6
VLRDYEILFIVRPDLEEEQVAEAVKSVDSLIASFGGTTKKTDVWGRRKLAYEVRHLREGHYVLTDFELDTDQVPELERALKISETVFRYLVVRKPDKVTKAEESGGEGDNKDAQPAAEEPKAAEATTEAAHGAEAEASAPAKEEAEAQPAGEVG